MSRRDETPRGQCLILGMSFRERRTEEGDPIWHTALVVQPLGLHLRFKASVWHEREGEEPDTLIRTMWVPAATDFGGWNDVCGGGNHLSHWSPPAVYEVPDTVDDVYAIGLKGGRVYVLMFSTDFDPCPPGGPSTKIMVDLLEDDSVGD